MNTISAVEPVETLHLFPPLSRECLRMLKGLSTSDWERPTACPSWSVKDVTAHLLGGSLDRLSIQGREAAVLRAQPQDYDALVELINHNNATWVQAARRINPGLLIEFLEITDQRLFDYFKSLDPLESASISVAWAGDEVSPNWFGIAREYTEKWLHQQHIREAVSQPLLLEKTWLSPVLRTFILALPRTFQEVEAGECTRILLKITGEAGGSWSLVSKQGKWLLQSQPTGQPDSRVKIDQDLAWRLFTRGVTPEEVSDRVRIDGDVGLGEKALNLVAIMA